MRRAAARRELPYFEISAVTGLGVPALVAAMAEALRQSRAEDGA